MSDAGNGEFAKLDSRMLLYVPNWARYLAIGVLLLTNPLQKLFWSQDVAMMTESFMRTALRNGLNLTTRCKPAPL